MNSMGYVMQDHFYEYSPADSVLWMKLFYLAEKYVGVDLCDILQHLRARGAILAVDPIFKYKIKPVIAEYAFKNTHEYENGDKIYLRKHSGALIKLLKIL